MPRPASAVFCAAVLWTAALSGGCAPSDSDSEAELRRLVADAETAAEARSTGFFRDLIAEGYADAQGYDREQLVSFIRGYFLAHTEIEVMSRIEDVALLGEDAARVVVQAALVGSRGGRPLLRGLEGSLYRIELELVRDGGRWQVIGAGWERSLQSPFQ